VIMTDAEIIAAVINAPHVWSQWKAEDRQKLGALIYEMALHAAVRASETRVAPQTLDGAQMTAEAVFGAPAPAPDDLEVAAPSHADFAALFQSQGIPAFDGLTYWFTKALGKPLDKATPEERLMQYEAATAYYAREEVKAGPPAGHALAGFPPMRPNQAPAPSLDDCPRCQRRGKVIPAGVSKKTGKPYGQFWACNNGCKNGDRDLTWRDEASWRSAA
jgi:hypothetical protein